MQLESNILAYFDDLDDPHIEKKGKHALINIIAIAIMGVVCGADTGVDSERYGKSKQAWLGTFLDLRNGIASHDTFGRVFRWFDGEQFQSRFIAWTQTLCAMTAGQPVSLDGKKLRGSHDKGHGRERIRLARIPTAVVRPFWNLRPRWNVELHVIKRMLLNNLQIWKGWTLLQNITTSTLMITGERDNYFARAVFDQTIRTVPGAEVYDVGKAKHKVRLERHQAVNRAMERFIKDEQRSSWRQQNPDSQLLERRPWLASYGQDTPQPSIHGIRRSRITRLGRWS